MAPGYSNTPELRDYHVRLLGTGASDPTKQYGPGVTVTRTAVGVFKFTFLSNPGIFVKFDWALGDATPSNVKGCTVTRGSYTTAAGVYSLSLSLWDSAFAAKELAATNEMDITISFKETSLA